MLVRQSSDGSRIANGQSFSGNHLELYLRPNDGTRGRPGHWNAKVRLVLIAAAPGNPSAQIVDDATTADLRSVTPKDDALFTAEVDASFLPKLAQRDWDQLVVRSLPGQSLTFEQHASVSGVQPAVAALQQCARLLPASPFD